MLQEFVELADATELDAEELMQLDMNGKLDYNVSVSGLLAV